MAAGRSSRLNTALLGLPGAQPSSRGRPDFPSHPPATDQAEAETGPHPLGFGQSCRGDSGCLLTQMALMWWSWEIPLNPTQEPDEPEAGVRGAAGTRNQSGAGAIAPVDDRL